MLITVKKNLSTNSQLTAGHNQSALISCCLNELLLNSAIFSQSYVATFPWQLKMDSRKKTTSLISSMI